MRFDVVAKFDVIIIGSGISGLICALELAKQKKTVCIFAKEAVTESSSLYAQGGIAVPIDISDSVEEHLADTLKAGAGLCNAEVAKEIISFSVIALEKLIAYGVKFDLSAENTIQQTKEAAHSRARVCHVGGDASGRFITKTLIDKASREPAISISQGSIVLDILKDENERACGILVEDVTHSKYVVLGKDIVIASGGLGQLYKHTTNPRVCTGDGLIMAYRTNAELQDIEMIQFHPTVLLEFGDPLLITEAIRGEGAKLKNVNGEYFAKSYHELAELAPRDILARAILSELEKTRSKFVYLEVNNFSIEYFKNRFPTIYKSCIERKINLFDDGIPVNPAAHYFIGGIKCDVFGSTNIPSMWAVGEVASNGFHGANRLASNSLLECIVAPQFLVKNLLSKESIGFSTINYVDINVDRKNYNESEINNITNELQSKNSKNLGLVKNESILKKHLDWLRVISEKFNVNTLSADFQVQELKNMILLSFLICNAALKRTHSIGVHYREDCPKAPNVYKHSVFQQNKELLSLVSFLR